MNSPAPAELRKRKEFIVVFGVLNLFRLLPQLSEQRLKTTTLVTVIFTWNVMKLWDVGGKKIATKKVFIVASLREVQVKPVKMVECRFCKDEVDETKAYTITEPDGATIKFCPDCAKDMIGFVLSGEAEKHMLGEIGGAPYEMQGITGQWISGVYPTSYLNPVIAGPITKSVGFKNKQSSHSSRGIIISTE